MQRWLSAVGMLDKQRRLSKKQNNNKSPTGCDFLSHIKLTIFTYRTTEVELGSVSGCVNTGINYMSLHNGDFILSAVLCFT